MDNTIRIESVHSIARHFFWMFLTQGILAVLMALLIVFYPPIIVILVAAMFLWMGIIAFVMAWRVRRFRNEVSDLFV